MGKRAGAYASAIAVAALMLLSSSLVLSAGSASAYQEGEFSFTLDGSPAVATITGYSGPGGSVVIPDHIGGQSVAHLGEGAFQAVNSITSVVIPDSVLTIGASAFSGCSALTSVTIGAAVTTVGDHAFSGCAALTSVTVGGSVTSLGDGAFQDCGSLTSVELPDSLLHIGAAAFWSSGLTSIIIPNSVLSIGADAFRQCAAMTEITIGNSVLSIGARAVSLTSVASVTFLGLAAPVDVSDSWIVDNLATPVGHAFPASDLPSLGEDFHGLVMGTFIQEDFSYEIIDGAALITGYSSDATEIVIPDLLGGYPTFAIGSFSFTDCPNLAYIYIPEGVEEIGFSSFENLPSLTTVHLPESLTKILDGAFEGCNKLTSVVIPDAVTYLGLYAFRHCWALSSLTIGTGIEFIRQGTFADCRALTAVTIPDNVWSIVGGAFQGCPNLSSVIIGRGVAAIGTAAFYLCTSLVSITFRGLTAPSANEQWIDGTNSELLGHAYPDADFPEVFHDLVMGSYIVEEYTYTVSAGKATVTGYTGAGTDLLIPDLLGGYPTTALGDTCFSGRFFITSAVVPDGVTSLGQRAFFDCIRLQSVIIPDSVTSAGTAVFAHCVSLVSVELGHGLTAITDYMFDQCYSLHNIVLPDTVGTIGLYAFSSCSVLDTVQIQEGVASIAGMAFFDCPALPSVWIPSTVLTIDGFAFSQDDALFAVFLSEGLKQIGDYAFASCPILSDIDLPNGLESIGASAFTSCTALTAIDIPDSVQSIGASAFQSCTSLADVHLGTGLTAIAQATFVGCTSLTNITLPDGVLSVGFSAFFNCNALQSIDLGSGLTSIGSNAFGRCFALNGVSIPEGVATIGSDAFNNCTSLCEVIIPDSVISLADQAFDGCTSLRSVSLGENLYGIGGRAFRDCGQLTSISFHGLVAPFSVGPQWLLNTNVSILGHAYRDSNFPTPGNYWHGLLMGGYLPVIPEAPQNLQLEQGDGLLTLTWAPPEYDGSSAILYYQVYRAESAGGEYTLLFSPQRSLYVDSNVSSGQTYWYQVSAVNAIGEGPRSTSASALVVTSPSAPRSLHAASGDSVINITWQVPLEDGGLGIDDYLLYRSLSAGGPYSRIASLEQTYYEDEDLVIGRTYYYLVSAENAMGEGAQAGPVHARAITLPSAPTWLHAEGGDAQVFLEWTEPYDGGSSIHSYAIYRSSMVGGPYGLVGSSASASFTDLGLVNGMTYWYRVSARNDLGLGPLTQAMAATPSTTPEAPGNLQASAGDAMVTLTWSAPAYEGGRSIDHYVVYQDGVLLTTHYSDFSAVISGLSNGREYTFTVAAHNEAGIGDLSSPAHATPFTVPDVPGDLQAEASDARVTLIWSAPAFDGGRSIDHYVVYQDGVLLTTRYFDLSAVISGLSNGHAYTFTVAAHNEAGLGDRSNPAEATPCTVPDAPSDLQAEASDARVTLTWSAPAFDGGRPIDYYLVYQDGVLLATHYSVPRAIISGLSNGREYTFTVTAHNEVGQSAPSTGASATPLTIPGMPRGLYAPAGDRSVMLQWDPPAFDGGRPIDYYLVYQDGVAIGHFAREAAISGLDNGRTYTFAVAAHNEAGFGPSSESISATPYTAPDAPRPIGVSEGLGSLTLRWSAPSFDGGRPITMYKLYWDTISPPTVHTVFCSADVRSLEVKGLAAGTTYYLTVVAINEAGEGEKPTALGGTTFNTAGAPLLQSAEAGELSASLTWSAPSDDGGAAIWAYEIYYGRTDAVAEYYGEVGGDRRSAPVDGLLAGVNYYFAVRAVNDVGTSSYSNVLTAIPYDVPGMPALDNASAGKEEVKLTWTAPLGEVGLPLLGYEVFYGEGTPSVQFGGLLSASTFNITIQPLAPGTNYAFALRAVNAAGAGPLSNILYAVPYTISGAPRLLMAEPGILQVTLRWSEPLDDGATPITGYKVFFGMLSPDQQFGATLAAQARGINVTALSGGVQYLFTVKAVNLAGDSVPSNVLAAMPFTLPSAPSGLQADAGNGTASLSWLAPAFEGGSPVDHYVIYQDGVALTTLPQTTNAAIGGLQNGRTYSFAVAAHNAAGLGPFSASATVLPYTAPDAPRGLTAVAGEAMVSLTWIAPAFDGGRTVDYYVVYQDGVALPSHFTTTSANISLLRNGQTYAFAVVAHNAAGNGTRSGSVSATPVAPPGVPSGVTLVVDGNKIVINWTAPEDGGSPILYYRVFRGGAGHDPAFIANATGTTYVDSNVSAGGYVYAVGAVTALGEGVSSVWVYANITSGTDNTALYLGAAIAACAAIGLAVVVLRRKG